MKTYALNITVTTKTTDIYDMVAINKHPILIHCSNEDKLKEILNKDNVKNYIKEHVSKQLYETAKYYIRVVNEFNEHNMDSCLEYNVKDITEIKYDIS